MKTIKIYEMDDNDRKTVFAWLEGDMSLREVGDKLSMSHENVRNVLATAVRTMYKQGFLKRNNQK